ncbi:MAG: hypothetical protein WB586_03740 [Chthoniobacterales bacterium]
MSMQAPVTASTRPHSEISLVPRDWLSGPVFSPRKQTAVREVLVNNNIWRMGIANPLTNQPSSQIDMTHVRVLLGVLSFWKGDNPLSMSIRELARRASGSFGGAYFKLLRQKLGELRDYWIAVELEKGQKRMFPALSRIEITTRNVRSKRGDNERQQKLALDDWTVARKEGTSGTHVQLDNVALAPEFVELLLDWTQLMHVRLDVLRRLTSDMAQAIYLFIPSRAVYHTKDDPWKISLTNLFEQLGMNIPSSKSVRKKLLTQRRTSVMRQLNDVPVLKGFLKVSLRLNKDKTDWLFLAWVEGQDAELYSSDSSLTEAWRKSGRDEKELVKLLKSTLPELTDEARELAKLATVDLGNIERFLRICTMILGKNRVFRMLAELKVEVIEGRGPHNPTGTLIWRLLNAISQPVRVDRLKRT